MTWNTAPADGLVPQAPPAEWLHLRQPSQHIAGKPRRSIGIRQHGLLGPHPPTAPSRGEPRDACRRRAGGRRHAFAARSSRSPAGRRSPASVRPGNSTSRYWVALLQQGAIAPAAAADREYTALAVPSLIQAVSDRRHRRGRDRADRRRLEPSADAGRFYRARPARRRAPGRRDARPAGRSTRDDRRGRLLQRRRSPA